MDHKAEFKLLILEKYGKEVADSIEWSSPRLLCIAGDFTKYDEYAVQQINRNIELIRYKKYGNQFILLELVNATTAASSQTTSVGEGSDSVQSTVVELLAKSHKDVQDRFDLLKESLLALGDDVQMKTLKHYFAFKRFGNFACAEVHPFKKRILVYVKVNPDSCVLEDGFTRDVRTVGHYGTGDLEITISTNDDLERAKPLLLKSYEGS
jgi:predicted transport protein